MPRLGAQLCRNHCGHVKGALKPAMWMPIRRMPFQVPKVESTSSYPRVLKGATWVPEMNGHGSIAAIKDGLNPDMFLLHPLRHKMPVTVLSASKGDIDYRWVYGRFPAGRPWS